MRGPLQQNGSGVTKHAPGHWTGPSSHLVQLWRGASGPTAPPSGRGPVPSWPEVAAHSQTHPPLLPAHRPFYRPSCSRTAGQGRALSRMVGMGAPRSRTVGQEQTLSRMAGQGRPLTRTAGRGGPSLGQRARELQLRDGRAGAAPLQNCGSRALPLQDSASPGALALPVHSCLAHCPLWCSPNHSGRRQTVAPHSGLTEPCLPPSNQSPEGSGRRPNSRFRPQASHVQRTSRKPWPGFRESRPVRHDGSCNTATDPSLQPLHPPREQSPAQHCSLSTEDLMSKGTPGEDLQTGHQGAGPGRGSGRQPSSHTLSM